jgi:hypothetical protein
VVEVVWLRCQEDASTSDDKEADVRGREKGHAHTCGKGETIHGVLLLVKTAGTRKRRRVQTKFCHDRQGIEKAISKYVPS